MLDKSNFYKNLLDNLSEGVYFVNHEKVITYWNRGAQRITGYSLESVVGRDCNASILSNIDEAGILLCKNSCPLASTLRDGKPREANVYFHHANGQWVPVKLEVTPVYNEASEIIGAVETFCDNSMMVEALQRAAEFEQAAFQDPLTEVSNRRYLELKLNSYLTEFKQHRLSLGLLFVDLDNFKTINDIYGHTTGDQALKQVASVLRRNIRSLDLIARLGGEEFVAVLVNVNEAQLKVIAHKLVTLVASSRLETEKGQLGLTISVGATLARPGDTFESFLNRADDLMYQSKLAGKNCFSLA